MDLASLDGVRASQRGRAPAEISLLGNLYTAWIYVWNESFKQKKNFFIGFTAVWLVVFSIVILQNTVQLAPVLFLIIGETSSGEMDIMMNPGTRGFINASEVAIRLSKTDHLVGVSPRWVTFSSFSTSSDYNKNASAISLIINSKQEEKIGLGRRWRLPPAKGRTCHVTGSLLRFLNVAGGSNVTVSLDTIDLLSGAAGFGSNSTEFIRNSLQKIVEGNIPPSLAPFLPPGLSSPYVMRLIFNFLGYDVDGIINGSVPIDIHNLKRQLTIREWFIVDREISDSAGKYPSALGNVVLLEMDTMQEIITQALAEVRKGNLNAVFPELHISPQLQAIIDAILASHNRTGGGDVLPPTMDLPPDINLPPGVNLPPFDRTLPPVNSPAMNDSRPFYLEEHAFLVVGMHDERYKRYSGTKKDLDAAWLEWTNNISYDLGLDYGVTLTTPLGKMLGVLYYLRLVLDQMLLIVEIFLILLGCYLIYSLLLSDVEAKVYESGMLRALGMQQKTLIALLSLQSLLFSIPGISVGLLLALIAWQPIRWALVKFTAVPTPYGLYDIPIAVGIIVGLAMPLVSLIGPVKRSLSKTLRDSLDLYHSVTNDTTIMVTKLENLGLSPAQTYSAILMVVFGFVIYYVVPLSFIFLNLPLFFTIFVGVLMGMIVGMSLLTTIFHTKVQLLAMHAIMWFSDRKKLKPLVRKNLHGHGPRNSKTAALFTICVAFIIFAGSIFQLQTATIVASVKITVGSDIVVATYSSNPANKIDEHGMSAHLDKLMSVPNSPIVAYGFSTFSINDLEHISRTRISNLAEMPSRISLIYGVSKGYLNAIYDDYLSIKQLDSSISYQSSRSGKKDLIESLYRVPTVQNAYGKKLQIPPEIGTVEEYTPDSDLSNEWVYNHTLPVIISASLNTPLSVDISTPVTLIAFPIASKVGRHVALSRVYSLAQPRAVISKLPGFFFSSYQQTSSFAPCVVSMDTYDYLRKITWDASFLANRTMPSEIPKRALFVRLKDTTDAATREFIANGLRNYVTNDLVQVINTDTVVTAVSSAIYVLYLFSNVVTVLVVTLCFFTLLISFTSNINENSWEFGVMRAIGLSSNQVIRLYIYEASCVIIASVLLGGFVGIVIAITLTAQAGLFSELPFRMEFPWSLFLSLVIMSTVTALLSSWIPARALGQRKIASVLKGK